MSAESELQALLLAAPDVSDVVGDRIAQNAIDQGQALPYIVYTTQHTPDFGLANNVLANNVQFRIECWAESAAEADNLANLVRDALLDAGVVCTGRVTGHSPETSLDATILVADWWE